MKREDLITEYFSFSTIFVNSLSFQVTRTLRIKKYLNNFLHKLDLLIHHFKISTLTQNIKFSAKIQDLHAVVIYVHKHPPWEEHKCIS